MVHVSNKIVLLSTLNPFSRCLLSFCLLFSARAASLPFVQDDFLKARAQAQQLKLPLFIECWAPW
jgi:hypothetical protein